MARKAKKVSTRISKVEFPELPDRKRAFVSTVARALEDMGHRVERTGKAPFDDYGIRSVDGEYVELRVMMAGRTWLTRGPSGLRYTVGTYGNKVSCPEPDKGFEVEAAVDRALQAAAVSRRARLDRERKDAEKMSAKGALVKACEVLGFDAPGYSDDQVGYIGPFKATAKTAVSNGSVKVELVVPIEDVVRLKAAIEAIGSIDEVEHE